jgi:hypothetical protein
MVSPFEMAPTPFILVLAIRGNRYLTHLIIPYELGIKNVPGNPEFPGTLTVSC